MRSYTSGGRGGGRGGMGRPVEKAVNFWPTVIRLFKYLRKDRAGVIFSLIIAAVSVVLSVRAPKVLGEATTVIFNDVTRSVKMHTGIHINMDKVFQILVFVSILYVLSAIFSITQQWIMTRIAQRTVYQLRQDFKVKMTKLPVSYYDTHQNGDIMSRVVNDMDNISGTLNQSLIQLVTSALTFVGVIYFMLTISWQLSLVAFVTVPISLLIVRTIAPLSQRFFARQQASLGLLNDQVEETFAGHTVVKTFNQEKNVMVDFEVLDEPEMDNPAPVEPIETDDLVTFENVAFSYVPDQPLMTDYNMSVKPGEMVAIVGPTGAGKSTMINLLERFYDTTSGTIRLRGLDTKSMSRQSLRHHFAMVLQETWLFSGTIMDNLRYGRLDATDDFIYEAAKMAHADDFIKTLPDGYDTVLNEEATNISQGQRQLLTIARAFVADPEILILDEATSSVDTRTERMIQDAMARLMAGRTSFVVAHRLSTIRYADQILVMEHGNIVERGKHDELLAANGAYAKLYNSQFAENVG